MGENEEQGETDCEVYRWKLFEIGVDDDTQDQTGEMPIEAPPPVEELL